MTVQECAASDAVRMAQLFARIDWVMPPIPKTMDEIVALYQPMWDPSLRSKCECCCGNTADLRMLTKRRAVEFYYMIYVCTDCFGRWCDSWEDADGVE